MKLTVGIIGGGLSGTLVAMNLLQHSEQPVQILIFEKTPSQVFRGVAYSSTLKFQPLNVRASHMNIYENQSGDFYRWLEGAGQDFPDSIPHPDAFVRRDLFGHYLQQRFQQEISKTADRHSVRIIYQEVTGIQDMRSQLEITTPDETFVVDYTVLALGNFLPGDPPIKNPEFYRSPLYESNPWSTKWLREIKSDDDVLFVGSGLTTVDQVINLLADGYRGKITILSRRGFIPKAHKNYTASPLPQLNLYLGMSLLEVVREIRRQVERYTNQTSDWRNVIDNIRTQVPLIWAYLSLEERKRFLRHVRPFWEVHRHRIPEESLEIIEQGVKRGQIEVIAGRLIDIVQVDDHAVAKVKRRAISTIEEIKVKKVINCTGPQTDYRKIEQPLLKSLMRQGWLHTDELNLGLAVNVDGQLINDDEKPIHNIYTIGSLRKGAMWECTALREIAMQAKQFVHKLNHDSIGYTV